MQKFMSARMVALVLVAGGLAACSGAESDKSAAHQPAEKPAVVASIDAQSDVAGGLDSDKPLDRLKEAPKELGKSLGRVMDTITAPVKKAFAPRVESKEMEKNTKAKLELHAINFMDNDYIMSKVIKKRYPKWHYEGDFKFDYVKYSVERTATKHLIYNVTFKCSVKENWGNGEKATTELWFAYKAERSPIIDKKQGVMFSPLSITDIGFGPSKKSALTMLDNPIT